MCKYKKWTLEQKVKIVKEFKKGATISYLNSKYGITSTWSKNIMKANLV